jgi:hypothetical protein
MTVTISQMVYGQDDHFDHDHDTILSSNSHGKMSKLTNISTISTKFKNINNIKI